MPDDLRELIALGEPYGVELKGPMARTDPPALKVVRAAMALSNRRDGGHIVIGVREKRGVTPELLGLDPNQASTWNYDDIADQFELFAEPRIRFRVDLTDDPAVLAVLRIAEFEDVPVLCKKDSAVTKAGACYVYPVGKAQVRSIPSQEDMRELLDRAAEKRLRQILAQVGRAGGVVVAGRPSPEPFQARIDTYFND